MNLSQSATSAGVQSRGFLAPFVAVRIRGVEGTEEGGEEREERKGGRGKGEHTLSYVSNVLLHGHIVCDYVAPVSERENISEDSKKCN